MLLRRWVWLPVLLMACWPGGSSANGEGMSLDAALRVALLKNRGMRLAYVALDPAEKGRFQTAALNNPALDVRSLYPGRTPLENHSIFRAGDCVFLLTQEVRAAYYSLQGAQQAASLWDDSLRSSRAALELAKKQHAAGNISTLELATRQARLSESELDAARAETAFSESKIKLVGLMGLTDPEEILWNAEPGPPSLPQSDRPLADYEKSALTRRLDFSAAQAEIAALQGGGPWKPIGYIQDVNMGSFAEMEPDGFCHQGKVLGLPLYIFGGGEHEKFVRGMLVSAAKDRLSELEFSILTRIRSAHNRLLGLRKILTTHQETLLPLHEKTMAETQKHHNFMLAGSHELLSVKNDELLARRAFVAALQEYWIVRAELDRLSGGGP